jgi:hypothetical protein
MSFVSETSMLSRGKLLLWHEEAGLEGFYTGLGH